MERYLIDSIFGDCWLKNSIFIQLFEWCGYNENKNSIVQVDNSINKDILVNIMHGAFLNENMRQLIVLYKIGNGYRVDYNTHPNAYCY